MVVPVRVDPTGRCGPTKRQAGDGWRRTSRGLYVPDTVPPTPAQRVVEAGVLVPSGSAVTGWASLCWRGGRWSTGTRADGSPVPVDVVGESRIRAQPLLVVREERLGEGDRELVDGLSVATAAHAVCFAMRYAGCLDDAVEALDMAYADDLVDPGEVRAWIDSHPGRRGIQRAREAWALGDENLWSPREVLLQLRWERWSGVRPLSNRPVFDLDGNHLGTPDLLDPVAGVAGEYEGKVHLETKQRRGDLGKEQRLRDAGLEVFAVVAGDLGPRGDLHGRLRGAYARAGRIPASDRRWTLEAPRWWQSTTTVAERRELTVTEREIWLPHLRAAAARRVFAG